MFRLRDVGSPPPRLPFPPSQLPNGPQSPLPIHQHTPALPTDCTASKARHDGLESLSIDFAIRRFAFPLPRVCEHLVVKRTRLQPHGGDAEIFRFLEDLAGDGGRGDDGDRGILRVGQGGQGRDGGDLFVLKGRNGDGGGSGVDWDGGDAVVEIPCEDCLYVHVCVRERRGRRVITTVVLG